MTRTAGLYLTAGLSFACTVVAAFSGTVEGRVTGGALAGCWFVVFYLIGSSKPQQH